jgi:hypothetical protein
MNGTFKVSLSTPIGIKNGIIHFINQNGVLSGSIRAMSSENPFSGGKTNGDSFEFSGILKAGFSRFKYTATGTVAGDTLKATAHTKYGTMKITGTRV